MILARPAILSSFAEGLLSLEDLFSMDLLTFDQALQLQGRPPRGVAWLLALAAPRSDRQVALDA